MSMKNLTLAIGGFALLALAAPAAAQDCGCVARDGDAVKALNGYQAAFAGRVQSIDRQEADRRVTLQVVRAWKGSRAKEVVVATPANACGFAFEEGKDYVVYATKAADALHTDRCSASMPLAFAASAVRQLNLHTGYGTSPCASRP